MFLCGVWSFQTLDDRSFKSITQTGSAWLPRYSSVQNCTHTQNSGLCVRHSAWLGRRRRRRKKSCPPSHSNTGTRDCRSHRDPKKVGESGRASGFRGCLRVRRPVHLAGRAFQTSSLPRPSCPLLPVTYRLHLPPSLPPSHPSFPPATSLHQAYRAPHRVHPQKLVDPFSLARFFHHRCGYPL